LFVQAFITASAPRGFTGLHQKVKEKLLESQREWEDILRRNTRE
jgi:hypothetical protein